MDALLLAAWLGAAGEALAWSEHAQDGTFTSFEAGTPEDRMYHFNKRYQPQYHLHTKSGWLNGPAGLIYFNEKYHLFYQYHPYNRACSHVTWGHAVSANLVDWVHYPPAIVPREKYEILGAYGGSVVLHNNYMTIFYTGQISRNNKTEQNQNIAISADGIVFQKFLYNPIVKSAPDNVNPSYLKNPKVWKYRNTWYMILGAMSDQKHGQLLLYNSADMFNWKFNGTPAESYGDMGYLWEKPDLFEIDGQDVLIMSVRGIVTEGYRYRNVYQSGYVFCKFNYATARFEDTEVSTSTFVELDHGHDFYAPHTMMAPDGRRLVVGWLGMWETGMERSEGWTSLITLVRELRLDRAGRLLMEPVAELAELRGELLEDAWYVPGEAFRAGTKRFELIVKSLKHANKVQLILEWNGNYHYSLKYVSAKRRMSVSRGGADGLRQADWAPAHDAVEWRVFVDHSSVEVFCGRGELAFSSRIYPRSAITVRVAGDSQLHIAQYRLRRTIRFGGFGKPKSSYASF